MPRPLSRLIVIGSCATLLLVGCTSTAPVGPESMGQVVEQDGGISVRVPVLWVDVNTNASGIEPAQVWVDSDGTPGFAIHLDSVRARGAGAAWKAASASAAAVATLITGADPSRMDIDFTITGPIDGPSAGGILTVGLLAALRQVPLQPGITMTGTISPDGSIGFVLGIPQKLRAAADNGYRTVVIPASISTVVDDQTGSEVDVEEYGRSLGVTVLRLTDVTQAYEAFTGQPLLPPKSTPYQLPAQVQEASESVSTDAIAQATRLVEDAPDTVPGLDRVAGQLDRARALLANGDDSAAYGLAVDATLQAARLIAAYDATNRLQSGGYESTRGWLLEDIEALQARIDADIARNADVSGMPVEQQFAMPVAMGWLTYGQGVLLGIEEQLTGPQALASAELILAAQAIADQRLSVDALFPNARVVVRSMPSTHGTDTPQVASFLSAYSDFLVRAGDANLAYADAVLSPGTPSGSLLSQARQQDSSFRLLDSTVTALGEQAEAIQPSTGSMYQEVIDASTALSHFVASGSLVAAIQDFSMSGFGIGEDAEARQAEALRSSIQAGASTVDAYAALLASQDYDSGYAAWSAAWGTAVSDALAAQDRSGAGAVLALNEIWYANINLYWTHAYALQHADD